MRDHDYSFKEIDNFKSSFKDKLFKHYKPLHKPELIQANKVKFGDVVSFRTRLSKDGKWSSNPYVCFKDGYMSSRNQTFKNSSAQLLAKIGVVEFEDEVWDMIEHLYYYNNHP